MLLLNQIKTFFDKNGILLREEKPLTSNEIESLYLRARDCGYSFATFIHYTVINPNKNGIETNFDSWDELYNCYAAFLVGFTGNQA